MVTDAQWMFGFVGAYLLLVVGVGAWYGRNVDERDEFYMAGRRMKWIPTALSYWATVASGGIVLGTVGLFYAAGGQMLGYGFAFAFVFPILFWCVGDKMRALGASRNYYSPWEFLADRYDSHIFRIPAGVVSIVTLMAYMAVGGVGVGLLFSTFTDVGYLPAVLVFYGAVLVYILIGGLGSVMYTDVVQGLISIVFFVIAAAVLIDGAGGPTAALTSGSVDTFGPTLPELAWYYTWVVFLGLMVVTLPDRAIRYYSIKNRHELRMSTTIATVILVIAVLSFMYLGGALRAILGTGLENSDQALILGLEQVWPAGVILLTVALWAAAMSTVDSIAIAIAAIIDRDIYKGWQLLFGDADSADEVHTGDIESVRDLSMTHSRVLIAVLVVASIVFAGLQPPFLWDLIGLAVGMFIQFIPALVGGLYLHRRNKRGAELGWIVGVSLVWGYSLELWGAAPVVAGVDFGLPWVLSTAALLINGLIYLGGYAVSSPSPEYDGMVAEVLQFSEAD